MQQPEEKSYVVKTNGHKYAFVEWTTSNDIPTTGDHKVIMCVHGLTRNSRDFDVIARKFIAQSEAKKEKCTVVCVDVVGRGRSEWLKNPEEYNNLKYAQDIKELINHICAEKQVPQLYYLGTSMGGIIGMLLFALGSGEKIKKFVANDVGAIISKESLDRIRVNLGSSVKPDLRFNDFSEAVAFVRKAAAPFGPLTDAEWEYMTSHYVIKTDDGKYRLHYDLSFFSTFMPAEKDVELWQLYETVTSPMLLVHGVHSDLLTDSTIKQMETRGPGAKGLLKVVHLNDCGHAPALVSDYHCAPILEFFN